MRPLQCPSCGNPLGAAAPGPGGRRSCPRCSFSFVPVHSADTLSEGWLERHPVVFLSLCLLPFILVGIAELAGVSGAWNAWRRGDTASRSTTLATGSGETPERARAARPAAPPLKPPARPLRYPATIEKVVPLPPEVAAVMLPLPGEVAPGLPAVPPASVEIVSRPAGAAIFDDTTGVGLGTAPTVLYMKPGSHRLRLSLPGLKPRVAQLALAPGESTRLDIELTEELPAEPGLLLIDSEPTQADVLRDGVLIGTTPLTLSLAGGTEVTLLLRKAGFEDITLSARVAPAGRRNIRAILPRLAGAGGAPYGSGASVPDDAGLAALIVGRGTAPRLGPFRAALPVLGSAASQSSLTGGIAPDREGMLSGVVRLKGGPPAFEFLAVDPRDQGACGSTPLASERLVTSPNGGLLNVVVWLVGKELDKLLGPPVVNSTLQIAACRFVPHVQAVPAGTTLLVSNFNPIAFSLRFTTVEGVATDLFLASGRTGAPVVFRAPGVYRVAETEASRAWLSASVHVMSNPFFTITDVAGQFTLRDIPKGDYVLQCWHEQLGTRAAPVSIAAGRTTTARFDYPAPSR